ncbi:DUF2867 domain-containing protein [Denitrobaculum tricleocarpae]|uniref:DUF2867 domain-containing protein n=1 Tax=Denitrobaculum tricleocarpae TaxID=2591009 RepID=A0A545TT74_9PROT|nr:DUF2867 domain-containing protein [Denitrobaculum tricleocarpae]TQV80416.1 DUF2867 domain-containing protein [Denitrobaculum tricleocarpae]
MTVRKTNLAAGSELHRFVRAGDFLDCYATDIERTGLPIGDIAQRIFTGLPGWIRALLATRDLGVKAFGLKSTAQLPTDNDRRSPVQVGEPINFFCVRSITENEIILGEDDAHLDFKISVFRESEDSKQISLATWVHTHNPLGRVYLRGIYRFHVMIVKSRLRALSRELAG